MRDQTDMNESAIVDIQKAIGVDDGNLSSVFDGGGNVESMRIVHLARWHLAEDEQKPRLRLPPIQRSIVWTNEQIINYWDSLLRGYLPGTMLVHRVENAESSTSRKGFDQNGTTVDVKAGDFQLFDGQQRISAILLGFGLGQMKHTHKLWVDLDAVPNETSGLRFQLRLSSTGQPFGYKPNAPNEKCELAKRQDKWKAWREHSQPQKAFSEVSGSDLIDAECAISFQDVFDYLKHGKDHAVVELSKRARDPSRSVRAFVEALQKALTRFVTLQMVPSETVSDIEDRIRFFARLGQGGSRLTEDELTYSIIKDEYPHIRDRMRDIFTSAGRFADEVDLVLTALRTAKTIAPMEETNIWAVISRPNPTFVTKLRSGQGASDKHVEVRRKFLELIPESGAPAPGVLEQALCALRGALRHNADHPNGFPTILLGRLPRQLVDVLVLFAVKRDVGTPWGIEDRNTLTAFALHWLLFVRNEDKAAQRAFARAIDQNWKYSKSEIQDLINHYEQQGIAYYLPRLNDAQLLRDAAMNEKPDANPNSKLRTWGERFTAADRSRSDDYRPGEALRILSTNRELMMRALMWIQREYFAKADELKNYDPTSGRDEDSPVDLDHIVPHDVFGFSWWEKDDRLEEAVRSDNFRNQRYLVGNSLGNFRWLSASDNRSRGKNGYSLIDDCNDLVANADEWNSINPNSSAPDSTGQQEASGKTKWNEMDVATFQYLIDLRTIELYEKILNDSGISGLL